MKWRRRVATISLLGYFADDNDIKKLMKVTIKKEIKSREISIVMLREGEEMRVLMTDVAMRTIACHEMAHEPHDAMPHHCRCMQNQEEGLK